MASGRLLTGLVWNRLPAEDRVLTLALQGGVDPACRGHLVEPPDGQAVWLPVKLFGFLARLLHDLLACLREGVEGRFALGLGPRHHARLGGYRRDVGRRGI